MKKLIMIMLMAGAMSAFNNADAQENQGAAANPANDIKNSVFYRIQKGVYNRAIKYNDVNMALNSLYHMCIMDPQNDSLLFSMAYLYFDNQQYLSAVLTLNDVLLLNPENLTAMEMKAVSLEQVGAKDRALETYETLYLKSDDNINFLYKVAVYQYELKRYSEAKTNVDILLSKPQADEVKYYFSGPENEEQEIPMRASLHNLKGMIARDQGNEEEAKKQFGLALEVAPDFYMAKQNLEELKIKN